MVPHYNHAYTPTMPPTHDSVTSYLDVNVIVKCGSNKIQSWGSRDSDKIKFSDKKYRQIQKRKILQVIFGSKFRMTHDYSSVIIQ